MSIFKTQKYKFKWQLENFSHVLCNLTSPIPLSKDLTLFLEIRCKTNDTGDSICRIFYRFDKTGDPELIVKVSCYSSKKRDDFDVIGTFAVLNTDCKLLGDRELVYDTFTFENNDLVLIFEVEIFLQEEIAKMSSDKVSSKENAHILADGKNRILKGLQQMKANELLSDFTYIVDGKKFPVHKMMLAARSSVFLEMFSTDFKESKEANLHDISKAGFEEFINFIHSAEVENLGQHAMELLMISDKFNVDDLKSFCENHLLINVDKDNALKTFQAAHTYHCTLNLKKKAFKCIKEFLAKWKYSIPEEFIDAPNAVAKVILMKSQLEKALMVENAQAEIMENKNSDMVFIKTMDENESDQVSQLDTKITE